MASKYRVKTEVRFFIEQIVESIDDISAANTAERNIWKHMNPDMTLFVQENTALPMPPKRGPYLVVHSPATDGGKVLGKTLAVGQGLGSQAG